MSTVHLKWLGALEPAERASEPAGRDTELAGRALDPVGRVPEQARRASEEAALLREILPMWWSLSPTGLLPKKTNLQIISVFR